MHVSIANAVQIHISGVINTRIIHILYQPRIRHEWTLAIYMHFSLLLMAESPVEQHGYHQVSATPGAYGQYSRGSVGHHPLATISHSSLTHRYIHFFPFSISYEDLYHLCLLLSSVPIPTHQLKLSVVITLSLYEPNLHALPINTNCM